MTEANYEANKGDWDSDFSKENKKGGSENKISWMKFPAPKSYRVRLIGPYVKFLRHNSPFSLKDRVITHESYKGQDPAWKAGFYPRTSYAIHIIDREDGTLKILEKGSTVFKAFAAFKRANDINPAGKQAPDFQIEVEWPENNKRQAKYTVTALQKITPITEAESAMWTEKKAPLNEIYKSTPLNKIVELWEALPAEDKVPKKRDDSDDNSVAEKKKQKEIIETIEIMEDKEGVVAEAESNDIFGDEEDGEIF